MVDHLFSNGIIKSADVLDIMKQVDPTSLQKSLSVQHPLQSKIRGWAGPQQFFLFM